MWAPLVVLVGLWAHSGCAPLHVRCAETDGLHEPVAGHGLHCLLHRFWTPGLASHLSVWLGFVEI
jgi:hypothetical protein